MKIAKFLLQAFIVFTLVACSDQVDLEIINIEDEAPEVLNSVDSDTFYENVFVRTWNPVVGEEQVEFRGEITEMKQPILVTYGFMWYDANDPNFEIKIIELGTTSEKISFSVELTDLPKKDNLVVCTFLRQGTGEVFNEIIGDEVTFSNL